MLTPLAVSIRRGHHQAAQVLRELERTARARKEAAEHANAGSVETTAAASQAGVCAACGSSSGASDAPLKRCCYTVPRENSRSVLSWHSVRDLFSLGTV